MSADNSNNGAAPPNQHHRRGSINPGTSPVTSLLQHRRNSLALGITPPTLFASQSMPAEPHHRRHTSVSATLGLASSPNSTFDFRRSSISTNGDSIDESAIEDNDRNPPVAHFARRMTVQPIRGIGGSISGGSPISDQGSSYNWGDHLRARAQSSVNGTRPVFGTSPPGDPAPRAAAAPQMTTEMPHPPTQPARPRPEQRPKPDAYQERILKGDFYMD